MCSKNIVNNDGIFTFRVNRDELIAATLNGEPFPYEDYEIKPGVLACHYKCMVGILNAHPEYVVMAMRDHAKEELKGLFK